MGMAVAAVVGGVVAGARGDWLGGAMLIAAAAWLASSARPARRAAAPADPGLAEAASMLGVSHDASRSEIEAAYRRLMLRVHPDKGGAPGLAAQLNRAREVLLRGAR